jgi:DNA polymerase I-like protein with 3'-5' exonuclease and polymerase domains
LATGERWRERDIPAALDRLSKAERIIGHNILRYDLPMLKKCYGWEPAPWVVLRDTKVIAKLKHPNIGDLDAALINRGTMPPGNAYRGRHTIASWGYRLGIRKLGEDICDWSQWTQEMEDRCASDVEVNLALWRHLGADAYSQDAIELEQRIDVLVWHMELAGVPFNLKKAEALHQDLKAKQSELEAALVEQFGSWVAPISPSKDKYEVNPRRTGARQVLLPNGEKHRETYTAGQPYCKLKLVTFNPRSNAHIEKVLRARGWVPKQFTPTGKAEIDEKVIGAIVRQFPEMEGLGELVTVNKRISQLFGGEQALMKAVGPDGRIHGVIDPMGTTTSRASHFHPNLGQVPSSKSPYGSRFRECFHAPEGWVLVGADQEGLEGRGLGHYMAAFDGGAYAKVLLSGDPHWSSAQALELIDEGEQRDKENPFHKVAREGSKTFYYALIYGAQENKCGENILDICLAADKLGVRWPYEKFFGDSKDPKKDKLLWPVGDVARRRFLANIPGFGKLLEKVEGQATDFRAIKGLDGRVIPIRSIHSALNFLIQSSGAILCKRWGVDAYDEMLARGWKHGWDGDFVFCLWVHDEYVVACRPGIADDVGEILVKHARRVGDIYKYRVALDSKYSIGRTWKDIH